MEWFITGLTIGLMVGVSGTIIWAVIAADSIKEKEVRTEPEKAIEVRTERIPFEYTKKFNQEDVVHIDNVFESKMIRHDILQEVFNYIKCNAEWMCQKDDRDMSYKVTVRLVEKGE